MGQNQLSASWPRPERDPDPMNSPGPRPKSEKIEQAPRITAARRHIVAWHARDTSPAFGAASCPALSFAQADRRRWQTEEPLCKLQAGGQHVANAGSAEAVVEFSPIDCALVLCPDHYQIEQLPQFHALTQIAFMIERVMNDAVSDASCRVRQSDLRPPERQGAGMFVKLC